MPNNKRITTITRSIVLPTMILFLVFTVSLYVVVSTVTNNILERITYQEMISTQQDMYDGLSLALDEVNLLYSRMVLDDTLYDVLEDDQLTDQERLDTYHDLLQSVSLDQSLFKDVVIYYNGMYLSLDEESNPLVTTTFIDTVFESTNQLEYDGIKDINGQSVLLIGKKMRNFPLVNGDGAIFFLMDEPSIRTFYDNISDDWGYTIVIDQNDNVISNTNEEYIGTNLVFFDESIFDDLPTERVIETGGITELVIVSESSDFSSRYNADWYLVSVLSYDTIFADLYNLNRYNLLAISLVGIVSLFISLQLSQRISDPFEKMVQKLRSFAKSGTSSSSDIPKYIAEIDELNQTYDYMIDRIITLIKTREEDAEAQRKLELYALQMQINPHFLYNTLDAIAWMAKMKGQEDIEEFVISLAEFFRISLHKGEKFITVKEELELIKHYLIIEDARFPGEIQVTYDIDEETLEYPTLKLILQPIIENAIKHGLSESDRQSKLLIKVEQTETDIVYTIEDNGVGFELPEDLFQRGSKDIKKGYGLQNVNDRIRLEYGEPYGIHIASTVDQGTTVTIRIKKP